MRVLLLGVENGLSQARMPQALKKAGWEVAALSPKGSFLSHTRWLDRRFFSAFTNELELYKDFARVLAQWEPRLVLPADDSAVLALQDMVQLGARGQLDLGEGGLETLKKSVVETAAFALVRNRLALLERARDRGVPVPAQRPVFTMSDAGSFVEAHGYPVVVKSEYGPADLAICSDEDELVEILEESLPQLTRARTRRPIFIQSFVHGRVVELHAACREGGLLASYQIERLEGDSRGSAEASVIRVVESSEVRSIAMTMINEMGGNGLLFLTCVVAADGAAQLIGMKFRMAPSMHMASRIGVNLPAALLQAQMGLTINRGRPNVGREIACYPYEVLRDPESPYLADHDVIEDDEPLQAAVDAYMAELRTSGA